MEDDESQRKGPRLGWFGLVVGAIVWSVLNVLLANQAVCIAESNCGRGDLILQGVLAVGFTVPAGFVALIVGDFGSTSQLTIKMLKIIGLVVWFFILFYLLWGSFLVKLWR
jgi:hypothetical protein